MIFRVAIRIGCVLAVCLSMYTLVTAPPADLKRGLCPIDEESLKHPQLPPGALEIVIPLKKKAWENALGGEDAAKPYIRNRLAGLPQKLLVDAVSLPETDEEFAWRVARDTWRGVAALTDRENGLPVDNVFLGDGQAGVTDIRVRDYTSGSNIGLHLVAIVAAHELQLLSADQATGKIRRVLETLRRLETYRGFFFNFYDTTSLERTSTFVSFVDSSWLTAGLMVVRQAFPELYDQCTNLISQSDYGFFFNPTTQQVSHGYYVTLGARSPYEYGMLYTEARLGSLIAMGKGEVPQEQWFAMSRTFPAGCTWQTQIPKESRFKTVDGHSVWDGFFVWRGLRYVPSWGGSMFEALMPTLFVNEPQYAPRSLGVNDLTHATVQRQYALEMLGYPVWGVSPSATPAGDSYAEYGVKVLGARGYEAGAVTPHASALALSVTPEAAIANLRTLAARYALYGEYGFYDAVDPRTGTVAYKYLSLDQSMLFIALANYLTDHSIQKHFAADPIMRKALPIIGHEDFFE